MTLFAKKQGEVINVAFNFLSHLRMGETLLSAETTVGVVSGIDYNTDDLLAGAATIEGSMVTQRIDDGMAGVQYYLTCRATSSTGNVYVITKVVSVLSTTGLAQGATPDLTGTLPDGVVGAAYSAPLQISDGYAPYEAVELISNAPPWMSFQVVDDELICFGTPAEDVDTSYSFTPSILDSANQSASSPQAIDIIRVFIEGDAPDGEVNTPYSYTYTYGNGTPPYTFSIVAGSLPNGVTLNSATAEISGTPVTELTYTWTVRVTDANNVTDDVVDTARIKLPEFFILVGSSPNRIYRSVDNGASFPELIVPGGTPPALGNSSSGRICTIQPHLYVMTWNPVSGNKYKYSLLGNDLTFFSLGFDATPPFGVPTDVISIAPNGEHRFYSSPGMQYSTDGVNFQGRTILLLSPGPGETDIGVGPVVYDPDGRALARGNTNIQDEGDTLAISTDGGLSFEVYREPQLRASNSGVFIIHNGVNNYLMFCVCSTAAPGGVVQAKMAISSTGAEGSWTFVDIPWGNPADLTSFVIAALVNPNSGRIVVILSNKKVYYSDGNGGVGTWVLGPTLQGIGLGTGGPNANTAYTSNNIFIFRAGYYYYPISPVGGGRPQYRRISEDFSSGWVQVFEYPNVPDIGGMFITAFDPPSEEA